MAGIHEVKIEKKPRKKVQVESEDEISIECRLCSKSFCNERAVRNHLRMEHSGQEVDVEEWVRAAKPVEKPPKIDKKAIAAKTQMFLETMQPVNITALASQDISYIIIKDEKIEPGEEVETKPKKRSPKKALKRKVPTITDVPIKAKKVHVKKERENVPITGPFECLEPSSRLSNELCHQMFASCCDYSIHYRDEHTRRKKAMRCQVCEKVLASVIGEEANSKYPCHVCGVGYETSEELTDHTNTAHVKLRPFQCGICRKRFTQQGGLGQHMRVHTGERPFPCTICSKAFTQKSGLEQHLRTHTKTKPYRCVVCSKSFIQSMHLKQHMRIHTNIAPYSCVVCGKKFKQSSQMNLHLKCHTETNMTRPQRVKYQEMINLTNEGSEESQTSLWTVGVTVDDDGEGIVVEAGEEITVGEDEVIIEAVDEENEVQFVLIDGQAVQLV